MVVDVPAVIIINKCLSYADSGATQKNPRESPLFLTTPPLSHFPNYNSLFSLKKYYFLYYLVCFIPT